MVAGLLGDPLTGPPSGKVFPPLMIVRIGGFRPPLAEIEENGGEILTCPVTSIRPGRCSGPVAGLGSRRAGFWANSRSDVVGLAKGIGVYL